MDKEKLDSVLEAITKNIADTLLSLTDMGIKDFSVDSSLGEFAGTLYLTLETTIPIRKLNEINN